MCALVLLLNILILNFSVVFFSSRFLKTVHDVCRNTDGSEDVQRTSVRPICRYRSGRTRQHSRGRLGNERVRIAPEAEVEAAVDSTQYGGVRDRAVLRCGDCLREPHPAQTRSTSLADDSGLVLESHVRVFSRSTHGVAKRPLSR